MKKNRTIIISILIFFMSVNILSNTTPQTPPPPTGDWDIFDTTTINNSVIVLNGNLTVHPSGSLTLNNVTLIMNSTYDGEFGITINGTLNIINGSNITAFDTNFNYDFVFNSKSRGNITDSVVEYCGYMGGSWGLKIESDNVTINKSEIRYGYIGIWSIASPPIDNNTIKFNDYVGIYLGPSSNSTVSNNTIMADHKSGIYVTGSSSPIIRDNIISSPQPLSISYSGIYIIGTSTPIVHNNTILNMSYGIENMDFSAPIITNNTILNCRVGVMWLTSNPIIVSGNKLINMTKNGIGFYSPGTISNNLLINNKIGIDIVNVDSAIIINCTILNSTQYALDIESDSHATLLNTTFNESKVFFNDADSTLTIQWFMNVNVTNSSGDPIQDANVNVYNLTDDLVGSGITGSDGFLRWIVVTERIQNSTTNITHNPHKIMAWNDKLAGVAQSFINESKTLNIVLNNGTFIDLEPGWNLVSLPRILSDTNLPTVLQSIEGQYDAVQWYDPNDIWKHNKVGKPNGNDLFELNETMGFWIHITNPGDTIFLYNGTQPTSNQSITLHPGWNMVGYPSLTSYNRTEALNNITFDDQVDAIWSYDATTQKWEEMGESDYFEIGRGYYIHAKSECEWEVPL